MVFGSPFVSPQTRAMFVQTEQNMHLRKKKNTQVRPMCSSAQFPKSNGKIRLLQFSEASSIVVGFPQ